MSLTRIDYKTSKLKMSDNENGSTSQRQNTLDGLVLPAVITGSSSSVKEKPTKGTSPNPNETRSVTKVNSTFSVHIT